MLKYEAPRSLSAPWVPKLSTTNKRSSTRTPKTQSWLLDKSSMCLSSVLKRLPLRQLPKWWTTRQRTSTGANLKKMKPLVILTLSSHISRSRTAEEALSPKPLAPSTNPSSGQTIQFRIMSQWLPILRRVSLTVGFRLPPRSQWSATEGTVTISNSYARLPRLGQERHPLWIILSSRCRQEKLR